MKQITQPQYDERFYEHEGRYYPSVTYILGWLPTAPELKEWIGNKGWEESRRIMHLRGDIGSYVHNAIELMIKDGAKYTEADIDKDIKDEKEALFVKRCLLGFMNFIEELPEGSVILESEETVIAEDYAGTVDLTIKIDGEIWIMDWKTSKSIRESHKIQLEAYRRAAGAKRCAVVQLGNRTKKRYTMSEVKEKNRDFLWAKFQQVKGLFYLENPDPRPTMEEFPKEFLLPKSK